MLSRSPPKNRIQRMVQRAEEIADNPAYGYSQKPPSGRWGPDFDCSSLMYEIANYAGYPVGTGRDKVRFTGTMLKDFEKAGFQILPFANVGISDLKIGDILLNLAVHAEVYVGDGQSIGALSSETGGYVGDAGDQTDQEIEKHPVITFDKGWDYVLRPPEDEENEDYEEVEEEGEDEMPMNYGPNSMMPSQPWNTQNQPWGSNTMGYPQGNMQGYPSNMNGMQGYPSNSRMTPNQSGMQGMNGMQGYPQGNLGQMNGYSQANAGGYQPGNQMPMGPQGMDTDLCFVMGIEGAKNLNGAPNTRKAVFDEDKALMYIVQFGQNGTVDNINVYQFEECSEEMPQHLSPLMQSTPMGNSQMQQPMMNVNREELMQIIREVMQNESSTTSNESAKTGSNAPNRNSNPSRNNRSN